MFHLMQPIGLIAGMAVYYIGEEEKENLPGHMRQWLEMIDPAGQHRCLWSVGKKTKFMRYEKHLDGLGKLLRSIRKIQS